MATKRAKQIWMTAAEIHQNTILMMSEPVRFSFKHWRRLGFGDNISRYFTYYQGDFSRMHYPRHEFDRQVVFLSQKMLKNPDWTLGYIDKIERWSKLFMRDSRKAVRTSISGLSDKNIIALYHRCLRYHRLSHGVGFSISWMADADKELVTKGIWRAIEVHLEKIGSRMPLASIFSLLTTPRQASHVAKEEKDFLRLAIAIGKPPAVKRLFRSRKTKELAGLLEKADKKRYQLVIRHHRKYCWLAYQYKGPATPLAEYFGRLRELFRQGADPRSLLTTMVAKRKKILAQQERLVKQLRFTPYLRQLISMAQRLVFIKDLRKDALYHGMYCYEPLFREIGRRLGLSLSQMTAMNSWEIPEALLKRKFDADELNARQVEAVAYADRQKYIVYTGRAAKRFLSSVTFEKLKMGKARELHGTPACPGKVIGTVKVINVPQQMKKMRPGDIMVAHNTNPNLVPAMKKAAALVSEAGGLTCHSAIVARELRTPCIVGVAGADKVLKDGDRVEVDANNGIVRKI